MQSKEIIKPKRRPPRTVPKRWSAANYWQHAADVSRSGSSSGGSSSQHTPSSIHMIQNPPSIQRQLSDLTGSYKHGTTSGNSDGNSASTPRTWTHAMLLSAKPPKHPQPHRDDCSVSVATPREHRVNVMDSPESDVEVLATSRKDSDPTASPVLVPLMIVMMDPTRYTYELSQQWIDPVHDTVRDCLHSLQNNLKDWPQDYDGLFSVRNNHFDQLIHILNVSRYDVQPYEVWIAKPWALSAKDTVKYAGTLLNYLKTIKVLSYTSSFYLSAHRKRFSRPKTDDSILMLSKDAQVRTYVAEGMTKRHHACQFLAFSPPFEMTTSMTVPDATCVPINIQAIEQDDASQLSSQCGTSVEQTLLPDHISLEVHSQASTVRATQNLSVAVPVASNDQKTRDSEKNSADVLLEKKHTNESSITSDSADRPCGPRLWNPLMLCRRQRSSSEEGGFLHNSDTFVENNDADEFDCGDFMDFAVWEDASFADPASTTSSVASNPRQALLSYGRCDRQLGYC